jgi:hypothetical protein
MPDNELPVPEPNFAERMDAVILNELRFRNGQAVWDRIFRGREDEEKKPEMKEGKRGEELFRLILSGIREIYNVDAVIAGGAVRDLATGYDNYKDVDVWVPMKQDEFMFACEELGWSGKVKPSIRKVYEGGNFVSNGRASARVQGVDVDLIFLNEPLNQKVIESWPVYAQRCVWSLDRGMVLSPEAKADIEAKQFTINPALTDKNRVKEALDKVNGWLKRKHYSKWKVIEPETKEWWEAKKETETAKETKIDELKAKQGTWVKWLTDEGFVEIDGKLVAIER